MSTMQPSSIHPAAEAPEIYATSVKDSTDSKSPQLSLGENTTIAASVVGTH